MFGLRSKKNTPTDPPDKHLTPVASEERSALLQQSTAHPAETGGATGPAPRSAAPPQPARGRPGNEACQRLMGVVTRFRKTVEAVGAGAPAPDWTDRVMALLIQGVETALSEGWNEMVEALTETGRILQTYEDARRPTQCVRFLEDSGEILSVMASDLLIGPIRSGVTRKWRDCHQRALQELESAGLKVVTDEVEEEAPDEDQDAAPVVDNITPFAPPPKPSKSLAPALDDLPTLDDLKPLSDEFEPIQAHAPSPAPVQPAGEPARQAEMFSETGVSEEAEEDVAQPSFATYYDSDSEDDSLTIALEPERDPHTHPTEVIDRLDSLCEILSAIERGGDTRLEEAYADIADGLAYLSGMARELNRQGAAKVCAALEGICAAVSPLGRRPDDKFFELAYAFCGAYVDADNGPEDPVLNEWVAECQAYKKQINAATAPQAEAKPPIPELVDAPENAAPQETPAGNRVSDAVEGVMDIDDETDLEALNLDAGGASLTEGPLDALDDIADAAAVEDQTAPAENIACETPAASPIPRPGEADAEDSPESLLRVAQAAVAHGQSGNAKLLALKAAVSIAKLETEQARARLREAETRLQRGAEAIEAARAAVRGAEEAVAECETYVTQGGVKLESAQQKTAENQTRLGEVENRIANLEAQIAALTAKRAEEVLLREQTQLELEQARNEEDLAQSVLEDLRGGEHEARVRLEDARQQVKALQRKRSEIEAELDTARRELDEQAASQKDIEATLKLLGGGAREKREGEMLF